MFKKVILNFQANFIVALLNLLITIVTAKYLGATGKGYLSIVAVYISVIQLLNDTCGASVVFYLLKKYKTVEIIVISYCWFFLVTSLATIIIFKFNFLEKDIDLVFYFNVLISSFFLLNIRIIISKIGNRWYNFLIIFQPLITIVLIFFYGIEKFDVKNFLTFQIFSYLVGLAISIVVLRKILHERIRFHRFKIIVFHSFKLGFYNQSASLSQIINYRFSYFYLEKFTGLKSVGVFSIILSFANVIWLFAVTIGTLLGIETSKLQKTNSNLFDQYIKYTKITLIFTLFSVIILYLIPPSIYIILLNKDFSELKQLLIYTTPAIMVFSISKVLAFFFSSSGMIKINLYASFTAIIPSIVLGYIFIKNYGIYGAIASSTVSFLVSTFILIIFFFKEKRKLDNLI